MLDEKHTFHPYGAWLCLYFVATTISPLRGYDQSGLTVGSDAPRGNAVLARRATQPRANAVNSEQKASSISKQALKRQPKLLQILLQTVRIIHAGFLQSAFIKQHAPRLR